MWRRALPVDPSLGSFPDATDIRPDAASGASCVSRAAAPVVEATDEAEVAPSERGRLAAQLRRTLLGPPLRSTAIARERMRKLVALPVLSADALSSVAYGPEAMLAVLVLAGSGRPELLAADRRRRSPC